jgi:glycosyltransferase involved in cell wall biosynthesis
VLKSCEIGVLSSASEGFPLALLEYGMAGLAVVATRVGKCEEVLDNGSAGVLVPPSAPRALGGAIVSLLQSPDRRRELGDRLGKLVRENYSAARAISQVLRIYGSVLRPRDQTK